MSLIKSNYPIFLRRPVGSEENSPSAVRWFLALEQYRYVAVIHKIYYGMISFFLFSLLAAEHSTWADETIFFGRDIPNSII